MRTTQQQIDDIDALLELWSDVPVIANPLWEKRRELTDAQCDSKSSGATADEVNELIANSEQ